MKHIYALVAMTAITSSAHAFSYFDGDFAQGDWSQANVGPGGSGSVAREDPGGNPGARATFTMASDAGLNAWINYWRPSFSFDPSTSGALTTISFSQDTFAQRPSTIGQPGVTAFLITQGGISYTSGFVSNFSNTPTPEWRTVSSVLSAVDFQSTTGDHPDFSASGSAMMFGVQRRTQGGPPNGSVSWLDNYSVSAQPVPEPASLAALLGAGLFLRRRRRQ
jgi:hypothetical protein